MDTKMMDMILILGNDSINAFYLYMALDYGLVMIIVLLISYGVRTVWNRIKYNL